MKKALLIGINYEHTSNELHGCINDVMHMEYFLSQRGFSDITVMTDKTQDRSLIPTKSNIITNIRNLTTCKPGDTLFFHYSGHGGSVVDKNNDEEDGRDETIYTLDDQCIIDDDLRKMLVDELPKDVKLICLFDSCHSGTILDLRYVVKCFPIVGYNIKIDKHYKDSNADIILVSGCKDAQTSADAFEEKQFQGALTFCFLETFKYNELPSYAEFIDYLDKFIKERGYSQIPQLSFGKLVHLDDKMFI